MMKWPTKFAHFGRPEIDRGTGVNPSVTRASTLLFKKAEDLYKPDVRSYGRHGHGVHDALRELYNILEGGVDTKFTPSGLSACTLAILANVSSGDHLLVTDSVYGPTRAFCQNYLKNLGVETEFYDPRIGSDISDLLRPNTCAVFLESPGSLTFEVQDVPAITKACKEQNIITIIDNTWSAGLTFKPFDFGVNVSVHAATKYACGHGDILFGAVVSRNEQSAQKIARTHRLLGLATSPDDAYQILRGFRTLHTRFEAQHSTALEIARWLSAHPAIKTVLHPALPSHPDHAIWSRDFIGGASLFGVVLDTNDQSQVRTLLNALELFGIGFSYGGYESVAIHCDPQLKRHFKPDFGGALIRLGCGLEACEDLKADLSQALNAIEKLL